jgi:predicted unusual protein kinase regulating ubiquinone biosynthesis (AarF/ABC1/UbiB family)
VKVQYPGIDKAIENDLKSLSMLETMIAPVGRRYHTKEGLDEIKLRLPRRARLHARGRDRRHFRKIHADDPDIVIPASTTP